jgi:putative protease
VLAPAGDRAALEAAVRAGADAVYFGLTAFSARARATNFDPAALTDTMAWLHAHGARGYVALNTLVFDDELPSVEAAVRAAAAAGVDALICQDLGVVAAVRAIAPGLPIHASTQMTCTDAESVRLAASLGATRVILARELSLDDIRAIRESPEARDVELEVFVHGALCISYSGQCLTSEAIGGRSANRGACAQACRLPYELVVDGVVRDLGDRAYLLSPEDLEASALVPELIALGVSSLKIEGRLKGPEYVAAATRLYRRAIARALGDEGAGDLERARARALQMYSRGSGPGFLAGVDHQRLVDGRTCDHRGLRVGTSSGVARAGGRGYVVITLEAPLRRGDGILVEGGREGRGELGGRVWALRDRQGRDTEALPAGARAEVWLGPEVPLPAEGAELEGRRVWKTSAPSVEAEVRAELATVDHARTPIALTLAGDAGERPRLAAELDEAKVRVEVELDVALAPSEAPIAEAFVRDKLGRLGDTRYALGSLTLALPPTGLLPASALNRARRALVAALDEALRRRARVATTDVTIAALLDGARPPVRRPPPAGLFVLCRTLEQAEAAIDAGADGVILDFLELTGTGAAARALRARPRPVHLTLAPPRIRKPGEEKIDRYLEGLAPDALLVRSLGGLAEAARAASSGAPGPIRIADFSLNVTNRLSAVEILRHGVAAFTPAFDLDAAQLVALLDGNSAALAPFAEVVVHHPMPLFHMEHCVIAALLSDGRDHKTCGRPCERHQLSLRDRAGMDHPVEADVGCRNTVFHAAAQSAAQLIPRLQRAGVRRFRVELVRERAADVARVVGAYRALVDGARPPAEVWRSLRAEAGFGVVRGSLRVLDA